MRHFKQDGKQIDVLSWGKEIEHQVFRCAAVNGKPHPVTGSKVVLTIMHLNHQPEDVRDENLLAGCQRCHNRYDAPVRARGIKERARAKMAIGDLFQ